jgi:ligand-binding SRPBCC domain-containing protein
MQFRIVGQVTQLCEGASIEYRIRVGPFPRFRRIRIVDWDPPRSFAEIQEAGPFRVWRHEHVFTAHGDKTTMEDRVYYAPPLGPLSGMLNALIVAPRLRELFRYRAEVMRLRFGSR